MRLLAAAFAVLSLASRAQAEDISRSFSRLREFFLERPAALDYRLVWDAKKQRYACKDARGQDGFNSVDVRRLLQDKRGECAWLYGKSLKFQDLNGAVLRGAGLGAAKLQYAELVGADLFSSDLRKASLHQADLGGADLRLANLREAVLFQADLPQADLRGADLSLADLTGADLQAARYDKNSRLPFDDDAALRRGMIKVEE